MEIVCSNDLYACLRFQDVVTNEAPGPNHKSLKEEMLKFRFSVFSAQ